MISPNLTTVGALDVRASPVGRDRGTHRLEGVVEVLVQLVHATDLLAMCLQEEGRLRVRRVALAGGVAANSGLREAVMGLGLEVTLPPRSRCTDNGAMIAHAGRLRLLAGQVDAPALRARPHWPLDELVAP